GEIPVLTSIYMVMPAGRLQWRHALIGGAAAAVLCELTRHVLVWYFARLSQVKTVYGSLATSIFLRLSLALAPTILLIGAPGMAGRSRSASTMHRNPSGAFALARNWCQVCGGTVTRSDAPTRCTSVPTRHMPRPRSTSTACVCTCRSSVEYPPAAISK